MSLRDFINQYFHSWKIATVSTDGTICGCMKLRSNETYIKIFFNLNGNKHWTNDGVTVDHIESCEDFI